MGIEAWSKTPASNNSAAPNGAPEGWSPASVNNTVRQQMADHRTQWEHGEWFNWGDTCTYASGTSFTVSGDVTSRYTVNRRIWVNGATPGDIYGYISASSYSAPNTTVTIVFDSGSMSSETLTVYLSIIEPTNPSIASSSVSGHPANTGYTRISPYYCHSSGIGDQSTWTTLSSGSIQTVAAPTGAVLVVIKAYSSSAGGGYLAATDSGHTIIYDQAALSSGVGFATLFCPVASGNIYLYMSANTANYAIIGYV